MPGSRRLGTHVVNWVWKACPEAPPGNHQEWQVRRLVSPGVQESWGSFRKAPPRCVKTRLPRGARRVIKDASQVFVRGGKISSLRLEGRAEPFPVNHVFVFQQMPFASPRAIGSRLNALMYTRIQVEGSVGKSSRSLVIIEVSQKFPSVQCPDE